MKRILISLVAAAFAAVGMASPAQAGVYYDSPDMTVTLNDSPYYHEYDLTFTCGVDNTIAFTGVGKQFDNNGEWIDGSINLNTRTYVFNALYDRGDNFAWTGVGNLLGTATSGTIEHTGSWNGYSLSGYWVLPNCAPVPVAGNHGQYVSGATKAGIKGKALAEIAKDVSLVGPYPG